VLLLGVVRGRELNLHLVRKVIRIATIRVDHFSSVPKATWIPSCHEA
jgi:hypothetical protein